MRGRCRCMPTCRPNSSTRSTSSWRPSAMSAADPEFLVAIPARFGASRLPGKPLRLIGGEPMVRHVVRRALEAGALEVVVATDDERIADAVRGEPVTVCMTRADHASGTDRLAECARTLA